MTVVSMIAVNRSTPLSQKACATYFAFAIFISGTYIYKSHTVPYPGRLLYFYAATLIRQLETCNRHLPTRNLA